MTLQPTPPPGALTDRPSALGWGAAQLGECGLWWPERSQFWWTDIRGQAVYVVDHEAGERRTFEMPELCGGLCLTDADDLLVALETTVSRLDPRTGELSILVQADRWSPGMRFNEVKTDPSGRVWAGYMNDRTREPVGWLFRLDGSKLIPVLDDVAVPNSLAWSADGRSMFFSAGVEPTVDRYDFDAATGSLSGGEEFFRLRPGGVPDGMALDSEGHYWCAHYGGNRVVRIGPDGTIESATPLPVSQPTSCTFVGPDLDILYITTARQRLSREQLRQQPDAGDIFAMRVRVPGVPVPRVDSSTVHGAGDEQVDA